MISNTTGTWFALVEAEKKESCLKTIRLHLSERYIIGPTLVNQNLLLVTKARGNISKPNMKKKEKGKNPSGKSFSMNKDNEKFMSPSMAYTGQ